MTAYKLNRFRLADAQALVGKTADITQWDENDDDLGTKITYPAAKVTALITETGPYLNIQTSGAVITDAATGAHLGTRPAEADWNLDFTWICEVTIRDPQAGS